MECSESILCGAGELELDPDMVSEEAGKVYSELQSVVENHGSAVVESLVPILVWVLEGLASSRARLHEREEEAEKVKSEKEELLQRFHNERTLRRESQERYLELDDQIEQERRMMRGREKERQRRERDLENKAREQADQLVALEEQKSSLTRDLNTLKHTHNKLLHSYRDVLEKKKELERAEVSSPVISHGHSKASDDMLEPPHSQASVVQNARLKDGPLPPPSLPEENGLEKEAQCEERVPNFVQEIISSTPELAHLDCSLEGSVGEADPPSEQASSEMGTVEQELREAEQEREEDEESLDWELRNTDSVFSELSELSRDYLESVDQGASVRGSTDQFEEILSQYEELKQTYELTESARRALICRVEELTSERSSLSLETESCRETITRLEGRVREMEEETKRLRKELETSQLEDQEASLPVSLRRFSRSEMARVVMEKNHYKERLMELQEAVRRSQALRATKDEKSVVERRTTIWRRFNRLFGLTKDPFPPPGLSHAVPQASLPTASSRQIAIAQTPGQQTLSQTQMDGSPPVTMSMRGRRRELYREIRSHVWEVLGKRQVHGWSVPIPGTCNESAPEPKDVPILVQLRLLDQRDATAKLTCATAVTTEISGEQTSAVWVISGPASSSDVTVIDPARANTVLDQFSLPPTSPALCMCAVPPTAGSAGTVWIGTQEGSILVHSASTARRRCLQSISLSEGVHSLTYFEDQVVAGLADGTLLFFTHKSGIWDLQCQEQLSLGCPPVQPIRCVLARESCLWVGYWNRVYVVRVQDRTVERSFVVSECSEQQVRFLCAAGSGVWASCRLDSCLRLFAWSTGQLLQEVDLAQLIMHALGSAFLSLSPLQITALSITCGRLWVGTGSGAVLSIPLISGNDPSSIPYCSLSTAQLCYHGHRQAVRFIISAPGCLNPSAVPVGSVSTSQLILSGGEGYINFRIGDDGSDGVSDSLPQRSERSHLIIWQSSLPSLPNFAL